MKTSYGICLQHNIPMRAEPSERAEMSSQVLFGETFTIIEQDKKKNFSLINLDFDSYEGWIDTKCIHFLDDGQYYELPDYKSLILHEGQVFLPSSPGPAPLRAGAGSTIFLKDGILEPGLKNFRVPVEIADDNPADKRLALESYATAFLSVPYLWGGRSDAGIDCSGLVQNLYKQVGIPIPRDASEQAKRGNSLNFISEALPGDLAFFDNEEGEITHVGMILPGNRIIHASGLVKTDKIDHQGIFSERENNYTHKLRVVKRVIG